MNTKLLIKLHFIILFPALLLVGTLFTMIQPKHAAADNQLGLLQFQAVTIINSKTHNPASLNKLPDLLPAQQISQTTWPPYGPPTVLREEQGGVEVELLPAFGDIRGLYVLQEGGNHSLWLGNIYGNGSSYNSITQRFVSQDGLVWHNRTNTNLVLNSTGWKWLGGPQQIIKDSPVYEGWQSYFYEVVSNGWAVALRYITSTNGITWTIVNQPALQTGSNPTVLKKGNTYHMWTGPDVDGAFDPDKRVRYRTSNSGGSGWGHWKNEGIIINVDGSPLQWFPWPVPFRVRQGADGTYQLFYQTGSGINLATSFEGITFTTQISSLINFSKVFSAPYTIGDFLVYDFQGENWIYFQYTDATGSHIAVSRPIYSNLVLNKMVTPTVVLPGDILTYTLVFSNVGNNTAKDIVLTDIVPSLLTNLNVNSNLSITNTGHIPGYVWSLPDLPSGATGIITITGRISPDINSTFSFTNVATITSTTIEMDITNNLALAKVTTAQKLTANIYLPLILKNDPISGFPLHIGNPIAIRPINHKGETFYTTMLNVPSPLPSNGHFYFSSKPTSLTEVVVDDEIVLLSGGQEIFSFDFSRSGSRQAAIVEVPRSVMEQLAGQTVRVEYRDIYGGVVWATEMWLIWLP